MRAEHTTLHYSPCGCAVWAESDGLHVAPCADSQHERRVMAAARAHVAASEIIRDVGPPAAMLAQAREASRR